MLHQDVVGEVRHVAGYRAVFERFEERVLVDEAAAREVQQARARLHRVDRREEHARHRDVATVAGIGPLGIILGPEPDLDSSWEPPGPLAHAALL